MMRKWRKSVDGWWSEIHASDSPAGRFGDFGPLVSTWQSRMHDGLLPAWGAFDIPDFKGWYGRLLMTERPGSEATFKLFGTELVPLFGRDFTRRRLEDAFHYEYRVEAEFLRTHFAAVTSGRGIGLCQMNFNFAGKEYMQAEVLTLPLTSPGTGAELALSVLKPRTRWGD